MNNNKYEIINKSVLDKYNTQDKLFDYIDSLDITLKNNIKISSFNLLGEFAYIRCGQRTTMSSEKNYSLGPTISTCIFEFLLPIETNIILFSGQLTSYYTTFFRLNISNKEKTIILLGQTNPSSNLLDTYRSYENTLEVTHEKSNYSSNMIPFNFNLEYDISKFELNPPLKLSFYSPAMWNTGICNGVQLRSLEISY